MVVKKIVNKKQVGNGTMIMGFSQKTFVFNKQGKFITLRRTETAPSHPLYWDLPGGDIEFNENPYKSMLREIKEETGLTARNLSLFDIFSGVNSIGDYWITTAYTAFVANNKLKISWEHDLYKWVTVDEFLKLKIPKKLRGFAKNLKKIK